MKFLRQYVSELVLGTLNLLCAVVIIWVRGKEDQLGYIVATVGFQITVGLVFLKWEMRSRFDELESRLYGVLELYGLSAGITHPLLRSRAAEAIEHSREKLKALSEGKIRDRAETIFVLLADEIAKAKCEILAVHVIRTLPDAHAWKEAPMSYYYEQNKKAKERKITVRRIFILFEGETVDSQTGRLKPEVKKLLMLQRQDGIDVRVVMENVVRDKGYIQDWAVIDGKVAQYSNEDPSAIWAERNAYFSTDPREVQRYVERFARLEIFSKELDEWLDDYDQKRTAGLRIV